VGVGVAARAPGLILGGRPPFPIAAALTGLMRFGCGAHKNSRDAIPGDYLMNA
jgi:hypothetical protein